MDSNNLYQDIATRTNGDIYIGVVGPVRTGKSTFIKKVMDKLVLPNMEDITRKQRVIDELPQSADGKMVMTTGPKFVPDGGVKVKMAEGVNVNVRLIDCVGYLIAGLEGEVRQVRTPWSDVEMPFEEAAEIGTRKVMREHSTIGVVVTTDGSIADFERQNYVSAEENIIKEMKECGKPFVIILNSKRPNSEETKSLKMSMEEKYGATVMIKNVLEMELEDILEVLECILYEFPIRLIELSMPKWMQMLNFNNELIQNIISVTMDKVSSMFRMRDYKCLNDLFCDDTMNKVGDINVEFGCGCITLNIIPEDGVFYRILSEVCNIDIKDEFTLFGYIKNSNNAVKEYDKLKTALEEVEERGYGVVIPTCEEVSLDEPQFLTNGTKTNIKMTASASCLHIMKVNVETEVNPIVGGGSSQEMVKYLESEYKDNPNGLWETNMFGKTLGNIAREGLNSKMYSMPIEAQNKLRKTVGRIVNEGKGGVLCVLL